MKSNVVIIHGSPDTIKKDAPENETNWIPWIKDKLNKKGFKVYNPLMPLISHPNYQECKKEFEKIPINENSILIGHSAGGGFLVRWLGETGRKIKKLILVAAGKNKTESNKHLHDLYNFDINDSIKERVKDIVVFISDNEPDYRKRNAQEYRNKLNGRLIEIRGKGHFDFKGMKTKQFPELLQAILE